VSSAAGNWNNSVASNGVVAYWSDNGDSIIRYNNGVYTTLVTDVAYKNTYPLTDGSGFIYRKHDPCCTDQAYAISYHDGASEVVLTNFRTRQPSPGRDYRIVGGWAAFTELGGLGQLHVWSRDPSGSLLQRTQFGTDSYVDGLGENGEALLINNRRRYVSDPSGAYRDIGSGLGTSVNINGTWYLRLGRSIFAIN
jgi:hypothetical protein